MRPTRPLRRLKTLQERRKKRAHHLILAIVNEDTVRFCRFKRRARGPHDGLSDLVEAPFAQLNRAGREAYWTRRGFRHLVTGRFCR